MALYVVWDQTRADIGSLLMTTTSTNGKSINKINNAQVVNFPTSPPCFLKLWPRMKYKRKKRFCIFARFELLAKSLWCPEQDLNLHSFRNTHLKRARLPIPPPGQHSLW